MTDLTHCKLIELAAKAAGIVSHYDGLEECTFYSSPDGWKATSWNPLDDDGDAFRLAVKLGMQIQMPEMLNSRVLVEIEEIGNPIISVWDEDINNPRLATRRAIVKAAAALTAKKTWY